MYAPFFGLRQEPFSIAPDPRYLFMSERHREALAHLLYGLSGGGGFVLLTGEIGAGKTTVCRCFLEQVPANCNVAYIFNPKLTVVELLQSICDEFHISVPRQDLRPPTVKDYLDPLNAFLLAAHAAGRNNVLIIDEAQNLSAEVLEQLRLLTNLETSERKLLQIILIGQPELRGMVGRPDLEQLAQRVIARYHLGPLSERETKHYVQHRLEVAGLKRALPFERGALKRIHVLSRGIPRRINLLCDRALLGTYARNRPGVSADVVEEAAAEVFGAAPAGSRLPRAAALVGLGLLAGVALLWAARQFDPKRAVATVPHAALAASSPVAAAALPASAASAPVAAASAPAPASAPVATPADVASAPRTPPTLLRDEDAAWRELARLWKAEAPAQGRACAALAAEQLACYDRKTSLALIRQLGRPGVVVLDAASASPSYALLVALGPDRATLRANGSEQTVTLAALAERWQGDFLTLWRAPAGYEGKPTDFERAPLVAWAAMRLPPAEAQADAPRLDNALRKRLRTFQLAQGLPVTGTITPLTVMQLNRAAGLDEPRLRTES